MPVYLYRRGDGNEGNFARGLYSIPAGREFSALKALVLNDYIAGKSRRRYIAKHIAVEGEGGEYGCSAYVSEGPRGVTAYGAAWLTAELQHIPAEDVAAETRDPIDIETALDRGALRVYRA
jgi:hypothetical protein